MRAPSLWWLADSKRSLFRLRSICQDFANTGCVLFKEGTVRPALTFEVSAAASEPFS